MTKLLKGIRYSSVGMFFAGLLSALQGCTLEDALRALLVAFALGLRWFE